MSHLSEAPKHAASPPFSPIPEVLEDLRQGKMVILTDDEDRENEGDLVMAAEFITPEAVTFMLQKAMGYLCVSLPEADCDRLQLHDQAPVNTSVRGTPFTVAIDGHPRHGFTTGVSAKERAGTIRMTIDPNYTADDFVRPGHINPLRSRDGGVLVRVGQTEGSVDLCRLAGLKPAAVIIEIMKPDGEMARLPDLEVFAKEHDLKICSVAQIIEHRLTRERLVKRIEPRAGTTITTDFGSFNLIAFDSVVDPQPQLALTVGGVGDLDADGRVIEQDGPILVRMHRRNLLGDIFSHREEGDEHASAHDLRAAMQAIQAEGKGAIVYLRPEGVGDDFVQRLTAINRPHKADSDDPDLTRPSGAGANAMPMHQREFGIGGQILRELGISRLRLLTNRPKELPGLDAFGLEIAEHVPLQ
ncbi:MAG: 3,4-dihydroxy-2-butanone-4-phosphate synthase [Phycisphaerales bacterium JB050]